MAIAIASNRASNTSIRRKSRRHAVCQLRAGKQAHRSNWNVALDLALTGCPVMHFYCGPPMYLLSGVDRGVLCTPHPSSPGAVFERRRDHAVSSPSVMLNPGFQADVVVSSIASTSAAQVDGADGYSNPRPRMGTSCRDARDGCCFWGSGPHRRPSILFVP